MPPASGRVARGSNESPGSSCYRVRRSARRRDAGPVMRQRRQPRAEPRRSRGVEAGGPCALQGTSLARPGRAWHRQTRRVRHRASVASRALRVRGAHRAPNRPRARPASRIIRSERSRPSTARCRRGARGRWAARRRNAGRCSGALSRPRARRDATASARRIDQSGPNRGSAELSPTAWYRAAPALDSASQIAKHSGCMRSTSFSPLGRSITTPRCEISCPQA